MSNTYFEKWRVPFNFLGKAKLRKSEEKKILACLYILDARRLFDGSAIKSGHETDLKLLGRMFGLTDNDEISALESKLEQLENAKMIQSDNSMEKIRLTSLGRDSLQVVFVGGTFDIIHPGHIETLEQAKSLGDLLIVSVARNSTVQKNKSKNPVNDEKLRKKLVESLKVVDCAVLGSEKDIFETVKLLRPDVIALGYDQAHSEKTILEECQKRNLKVKVTRLDSSIPEVKTSRILSDTERGKKISEI